MRAAAALIAAALLLSACDADTIVSECPALKVYSRETLERAARELDALPMDSALRTLAKDYGSLRAACRTK